MIVNPVVQSGGGGSWTSISSEESKNRVMRAPPIGTVTTFVIPGIENPNSVLILRGTGQQQFFACGFYTNVGGTTYCDSSNYSAYAVNIISYQNDQYAIQINTEGTTPVDVIEYMFVEVLENV